MAPQGARARPAGSSAPLGSREAPGPSRSSDPRPGPPPGPLGEPRPGLPDSLGHGAPAAASRKWRTRAVTLSRSAAA